MHKFADDKISIERAHSPLSLKLFIPLLDLTHTYGVLIQIRHLYGVGLAYLVYSVIYVILISYRSNFDGKTL